MLDGVRTETAMRKSLVKSVRKAYQSIVTLISIHAGHHISHRVHAYGAVAEGRGQNLICHFREIR